MAGNPEVPFEIPRTPTEYRRLAKDLEERGMSILDAKEGAADHRKNAIQYLKDTYGLNGDAEKVIENLELFHQEAEAKKKWGVWDYVKYPFAKTWQVAKKHPWLTTLAVGTAVTAGAYYTGNLTPAVNAVKKWFLSLGLGKTIGAATGAATEVAAEGMEAGKAALEGLTEGAGEAVIDVIPGVPDSTAEGFENILNR